MPTSIFISLLQSTEKGLSALTNPVWELLKGAYNAVSPYPRLIIITSAALAGTTYYFVRNKKSKSREVRNLEGVNVALADLNLKFLEQEKNQRTQTALLTTLAEKLNQFNPNFLKLDTDLTFVRGKIGEYQDTIMSKIGSRGTLTVAVDSMSNTVNGIREGVAALVHGDKARSVLK